MAKTALISLIKPIEATRLNPRNGLTLGQPDVTVPYGALIEYVGSDRDRERFHYLSELYGCRHEAFVSATGGAMVAPKPAAAPAVEPEMPAETEAAAPVLAWDEAPSNAYTVQRARIPGGWLVTLDGSGLTFVPDPAHRWDGGSEE